MPNIFSSILLDFVVFEQDPYGADTLLAEGEVLAPTLALASAPSPRWNFMVFYSMNRPKILTFEYTTYIRFSKINFTEIFDERGPCAETQNQRLAIFFTIS